jgi:hypothetical protein
MSIAVLNTDTLNLQCAFGLSYYHRLILIWSLPIIVAGIFKLYAFVCAFWAVKKKGLDVLSATNKWNRFAGGLEHVLRIRDCVRLHLQRL